MTELLRERRACTSADGSTKLALELQDGRIVEAVRIPREDEIKICLSSQIGCAHKCKFCTTVLMGLERNMTASEISAQAYTIADRFHDSIEDYHLIFMGMGEPFLNYENVLACVSEFVESCRPVRDVTISTSGVPHAIRRLGGERVSPTLAVSIVSVDQRLRQQLMPQSKHFPLQDVFSAIQQYQQQKRKEVILEYVLLEGVV